MIHRLKYNIKWSVVCIGAGLMLWSFVWSQTTLHRSPVLQYTTDKEVDVTIFLVSSEDHLPLYYSARLQSPVCMENLCNPIDIEIEWDLLGDFKSYNETPGDPVTKFDHQPLDSADHQKLKSILANKESLLQDYEIEDLVDTTVKVYSKEIDAMTGATSKTFDNEIVSGAIYTCYTLWHFVNGELPGQLLRHTKSILDNELILAMIQTRQDNYLNYIFGLPADDLSECVHRAIGSLIWESDPYISVKAVSAVHDEYWKSDSTQMILADRFLLKENPVQNAIIQEFSQREVEVEYFPIFVDLLPDLNKRQREQVYEILKDSGNKINDETKNRLLEIFKSPGYALAAKEYELMSILGISF